MERKGKFASADAVFSRISEIYHLDGDAAIGKRLGTTNQNVYQYRRRDSIPFELILTACPPTDWEYIFTGQNRVVDAAIAEVSRLKEQVDRLQEKSDRDIARLETLVREVQERYGQH